MVYQLMQQDLRTKITAYADDVTVFVNDNNDIKDLSRALELYEVVSLAKVNWDKTEPFWSGQRHFENIPQLWHKFIVLQPPVGLV